VQSHCYWVSCLDVTNGIVVPTDGKTVTASIVLATVRFAGVTTIAKMSTVAARRCATGARFGLEVALGNLAWSNETHLAA